MRSIYKTRNANWIQPNGKNQELTFTNPIEQNEAARIGKLMSSGNFRQFEGFIRKNGCDNPLQVIGKFAANMILAKKFKQRPLYISANSKTGAVVHTTFHGDFALTVRRFRGQKQTVKCFHIPTERAKLMQEAELYGTSYKLKGKEQEQKLKDAI